MAQVELTEKPADNSGEAKNSTWILIATILGTSMVFIDGTVVNVALPVLQTELGATVGAVQWVVEGYTLFLAALLLVGGSLGDHFGRRLVYVLGIILFTLASIGCGIAPNIGFLVLARSIQGIGGALLVPGSLAIISASFTNATRRGRAIGTWSGFTAITSALGPGLGGWLVQTFGWRVVFFINVPLAVLVLLIIFRYVPESRDEKLSRALDWAGAVLTAIGLGGLVYGLIEAGNSGFTNGLVLTALAIGLAALVGFLVVEARSPHPMLPLTLFRSATFSGANLLTLLLYGALGGAFFFVPFNLIQVQGYSPTEAGLVFLPFVLIMFSLSRWTGGLVGRYGAKLPLIVGPIIAGAGFTLLSLPDIGGSYWLTYFPAIVVLGLGMSITVAPLTTTVMGAVPVNEAGIASGVNNALSRVAGLLAIAIFGLVVVASFGSSLDQRLTNAAPSLTTAQRQIIDQQNNKLTQLELPADLDSPTKLALQNSINEAFVDSFRLVMRLSAGLAVLSAVAAFILVEGKTKQKPALP
jgi:EmrB/QacA subfamily drug resistance transporter